MTAEPAPASRAARKLEHALDTFELDVDGMICADFGCSVGGFTDCLLRRGAARVIAVDTAYGVLAYRLRMDERVEVRERTNALHAEPPAAGVDLVVVDLGWTPQRHAIPAALRWLAPAGDADRPRIVSLVKPHYELDETERRTLLVDGSLDPGEAERVLTRTLAMLPALGADPLAHTRSPITGAKSARRGRGNVEFLVLMTPRAGSDAGGA